MEKQKLGENENQKIINEIEELLPSDTDKEYLPDVMVNKDANFRGNPLLKSLGEEAEFTQEHIEELKKCINDPVYFAEKYVKILHIDKGVIPIKLYPYQKRILTGLHEHRYSIVLSCRQSGKCVHYDTIVKLKNKNIYGGKPFSIKIGDFYTWMNFCEINKGFIRVV